MSLPFTLFRLSACHRPRCWCTLTDTLLNLFALLRQVYVITSENTILTANHLCQMLQSYVFKLDPKVTIMESYWFQTMSIWP